MLAAPHLPGPQGRGPQGAKGCEPRIPAARAPRVAEGAAHPRPEPGGGASPLGGGRRRPSPGAAGGPPPRQPLGRRRHGGTSALLPALRRAAPPEQLSPLPPYLLPTPLRAGPLQGRPQNRLAPHLGAEGISL